MKDLTQQLLEKYSAKTIEHTANAPLADDDQLWSYRQAAALLHCFVPGSVNPLAPEYLHKSPFALLHDDIINFSGGFADGLYTLKPAVRTEALKRFTSRKAMQAGLKANPSRIQTPLQDMWEDYLNSGLLPKAEALPYRQLINLYQIVGWLNNKEALPQYVNGGVRILNKIVGWLNNKEALPDETELLKLIKRKSVLANFEHLVISNFTGREEELEMFRRHITGNAGTSTPILSIFGPGGIGKSALVGKILYERATADDEERLPYIYLAFDQPSLRIENPLTILSEAAAQLELQYPEMPDAFQHFKGFIRKYSSDKSDHSSRGVINKTRGERASANFGRNERLYEQFAELLGEIGSYAGGTNKIPKNILLTLDTFEEVQYRDQESLYPFWNMLETIILFFPYLRVLIAGRTAITTSYYPTKLLKEIPLNELTMTDRVLLLTKLGFNDNRISLLVAERVGGNPLSLRLAARAVTAEQNIRDLENVIPESWLLFKLDEQLIQGQLYKRILNHIHDEDVRKLAHPGMVLRKVTSALIMEVLAPVCNIAVADHDRARELFAELEKEHALVQMAESDTLKFRPEIRQVMVRLLQQDKYEEVKLLHQHAIDFYYYADGTDARAEELYHRLALGEDEPYVLNDRWTSGIEQSIAANLDEYSDGMKAWLASKMSLEVPRAVFENASTIEWERNITRKVKKALLNMDLPRVFKLLEERQERSPSSPLFALEAKACLLQKNYERADKVADEGINVVSQSANRGRLAELFWLKSQVSLLQEKISYADECLMQAQAAIQQATNPVALIHVLCQRILLHKTYPVFSVEDDQALLAELSKACFRLNKNQKSVPPFIISLAAGYLEDAYPKTISRLKEYFFDYVIAYRQYLGDQKDMLMNENLRGLEKYRESWEGNDEDDDEGQKLETAFESFV